MTKVVLLGDSITQGLGSKKTNFTQYLQHLLGENHDVINLAYTGTTIFYCDLIMDKIMKINPDIVVIVYGNVDAQIRPNSNGKIFPLIPKRYKNAGMLYPRPFYSSKLYKKLLEHLDNFFRRFLNKLIRIVDGTEQLVSEKNFTDKYNQLIDSFLKMNIKIVSMSTVFIDDKFFKGSLDKYSSFNNKIEMISKKYKIPYINIFSVFKNKVTAESWEKYYCHDHFHPNKDGYKIMAELINDTIKKMESETDE